MPDLPSQIDTERSASVSRGGGANSYGSLQVAHTGNGRQAKALSVFQVGLALGSTIAINNKTPGISRGIEALKVSDWC